MITSDPNIPDEQSIETTLRPQRFSEYVGQEKIKRNLDIFIQAAKKRKKASITCSSTDPLASGKPPSPHHCQRNGGQYQITSGPLSKKSVTSDQS